MTTPPGKNAGAGSYVLFVSAIDEAQARGARSKRKARIGRPRRTIADLQMRHLKRLEVIGRRLDKRLASQDPDWLPDEAFIRAQVELAGAFTKLERSIRLAREAEAKAMGGLSDDQLCEVLRIQLPRIAASLDESDLRTILSIAMADDIAEAAIAVWKRRQGAGS